MATRASVATPVEAHFTFRPQLRDPDEGMVPEAAINGGADALVTFNLRDFGDAPGPFGIKLLRPRQLLRSL
jgi:predicted nucleic acid-binding protein